MSHSSVTTESIVSETVKELSCLSDEKRSLIRDNLVTLNSLIEGLAGIANSSEDNLAETRFSILGLSLFWKNHCKDIVWEI